MIPNTHQPESHEMNSAPLPLKKWEQGPGAIPEVGDASAVVLQSMPCVARALGGKRERDSGENSCQPRATRPAFLRGPLRLAARPPASAQHAPFGRVAGRFATPDLPIVEDGGGADGGGGGGIANGG